MEPHTIDEHEFGEDCPDCGGLCAEALVELLSWALESKHKRVTVIARLAAIYIQFGQLTPKEARLLFGIKSKQTIYNQRKLLAKQHGMKYEHGKVL
jgi:hypothetical protein